MERGYIETLLELPWDKYTKDNTDISQAENILERDHYGLKQVKERGLVYEFHAVQQRPGDGCHRIRCGDEPVSAIWRGKSAAFAERQQKKSYRRKSRVLK